jgi:hypothetical protein
MNHAAGLAYGQGNLRPVKSASQTDQRWRHRAGTQLIAGFAGVYGTIAINPHNAIRELDYALKAMFGH